MITDLFSHKIHSSGNDWGEKLAELALIFGEFDGQLFDRNAFEERLKKISPRTSYVANSSFTPTKPGVRFDPSKFRDEISAYPSYLGLYFLEQSPQGWTVKISQTARKFLLHEEPDVASFLRLQLPLFQYPNAMGAAYKSFSNKLRIQANARDRTFSFINSGIHFSPVRLICVALQADSLLREVNIFDSRVSFREIFALANSPKTNKYALPNTESVSDVLKDIREGRIKSPERYESRFHTLKHMEIFKITKGIISLRKAVSEEDNLELQHKFQALCKIDQQFNDFDDCETSEDLKNVIASGKWGKYFDGVRILSSEVVEILSTDKVLEKEMITTVTIDSSTQRRESSKFPTVYPLRERRTELPQIEKYNRKKEIADPEITKIKRQRRNLAHKELINQMDSWLRALGAVPKENEHIDLYAKIPNDGSFIFEIKSGGDSLLEQIRKGLSQLYEYRFRYRNIIADDHISLCLVLPNNPRSIPWITTYLCEDREINICWFDEMGCLKFPEVCNDNMQYITAEYQSSKNA